MFVANGNSKNGKKGNNHPFAKKEPKPTRARLVSLLDPLGRKRYAEVERFLATITGATSGLHYYDADWGWAVRYMLGSKEELCTLHLLPEIFEATVALKEAHDVASNDALITDLKRRISRTPLEGTVRWVRLPLRSDIDYQNFQTLIKIKSEIMRSRDSKKKPAAAAAAAAS